ncbi:NAD-dependent epimerase/dehydratase family protein [Actinoplanes sp. G11-F43]|uniref:NAD-dependent epimerase/dehydratase family protein n=1 Tax=Actinoplanes sp. G11-F43 TaxID=3424130 RepID=UPI003D35471E
MRVIVFGATGMVGQGTLEACLRDDTVTEVLVVGRSPTGRTHPKLREIQHADFTDFTGIADRVTGYDACFFCLGVSALGMSEQAYRAVTVDFTLAAARTLLAANPEMAFCYVSGIGADGTGKTRMMWARVKGELENTLLTMSPSAYMFRPAFVLPLPGGKAKTTWYVLMYRVLTPLYPVLRRVAPRFVTTSLILGEAMLATARDGASPRVLEAGDINEVAGVRT